MIHIIPRLLHGEKKYQTYAIVPSFGILQVIWNATYETMDLFYNEGITQKYVNSSFNWIAQTFGLQLQYPHNISI